jgi:hypothetical protein
MPCGSWFDATTEQTAKTIPVQDEGGNAPIQAGSWISGGS